VYGKTINDDCMRVMACMGDSSVVCTCTDIPYGVVNRKDGIRKYDKGKADEETFDLGDFIDNVVRVTKGSAYVFCGTEQVSFIRARLVERGMSTRLMIWEKTNPSPALGQYMWLSGVECCVYGRKKGATFNRHCKNSVLRFPTTRSKIHPTQKPVALLEELITASTNEGDTVFDPCMGSGSTGVAALNNRRSFIGVELCKDFYDLAKKKDRIRHRDDPHRRYAGSDIRMR